MSVSIIGLSVTQKIKSTFSVSVFRALALLSLVISTGCATVTQPDPNDPWESYNRSMFEFNDAVDQYTLKPVSQAYDYVTPEFVQNRVTNFFSNLDDLNNFVHGVLQFEFETAMQDFSRFLINSTIGLGGLFEVTEDLGILTPKHNQDMGKTLATWGVGQGPYVVLPLLGPATTRSAAGRVPDIFLSPMFYLGGPYADEISYSLTALELIDLRKSLLDVEDLIVGDRYDAVRDAYLSHRYYIIHGELPVSEDDAFLDDSEEGGDDWGDDDW